MKINNFFSQKSVASESIYFLLANILFAIIPFILLPFLTEVLSTQQYGQIAIFSLLTAVTSTFVGLNLHGAIAVFYHKFNKDIHSFIQNSIYISTANFVITVILIYVFNPFLAKISGLDPIHLYFVALVSYFQHNINLYLVKIQNDFNAKLYSLIKVSQGVLEGILTFILVYDLELGVMGRIYSATLISVLFFLIILISNIKAASSIRLSLMQSRKLLNFGIPLVPHAFFTMVMSISDRFIIANKLNLSEAGIYMLGVQLASAIVILNDSINRAFKPWLYSLLKDINDEKKEKIVNFSYIYALFNVFLSFVYYFFVMAIFDNFIDPKFNDVKSILHFLVMGGCFIGFYYNFASFLFYYGKNLILSIATTLIGLGSLALNILFIQTYGLGFAANVYAFSQFLLFAFCFLISIKLVSLPWLGFKKK